MIETAIPQGLHKIGWGNHTAPGSRHSKPTGFSNTQGRNGEKCQKATSEQIEIVNHVKMT